MNAIPSLLLVGLLGLAVPGFAQQPAATPQAAPVVYPPTPEPDPAMLKAMKSKVFVVNHRNPHRLVSSLRALGSGVRGSRLDSEESDGVKTISVRDFPENIAAIEEAIKRMDAPSAASAIQDVEIHVQVLFASKQPVPEGSLPEELLPVVKSLKGTLSYRGYTLAATFVQRWDLSRGRAISGRGQVDGAPFGFGTIKDPSQLKIEWEAAQGFGFEPKLNADLSLQIPRFALTLEERLNSGSGGGGGNTLAKIETSVNLKEGEHVVVGTSVIKGQGLVVVLTARRVN